MATVQELLDTLKTELRRRRVTYARVGEVLGLSESSVKRLFSEGDMSITRLQKICELADLDIGSLSALSEESRRQLKALPLEDERTLVGDEKLLLLAVHLMNGWSYQRVLNTYHIEPAEGQQSLTRLDRMKLIELHPGNRVRVLISPDFQWLKGGPIQRFFEKSVQGAFFESGFSGEGEMRMVLNGWLSMQSIKGFHDNIRRLAREFEAQKQTDKAVPLSERKGTTLVMAVRPWALEIFEKYAR